MGGRRALALGLALQDRFAYIGECSGGGAVPLTGPDFWPPALLRKPAVNG